MIRKWMRIVITVIAATLLLWFAAPALWHVLNPGNLLGMFLCACLIFRFGMAKVYWRCVAVLRRKKIGRFFVGAVRIGCVSFSVYAAAVSALMVFAAVSPPAPGATAVVLGAQVKPWGPSPLLRQRISAAENYLTENPCAAAVLSGGQGADEPVSEAQCMFDEISGNERFSGNIAERLFREDKSANTGENIRFSFRVIEENGLDPNIAVVTDSYHQLRARMIAAAVRSKESDSVSVGAVNASQSWMGLGNYPTYFVREWIAIPAEAVKLFLAQNDG